MFHIRRTVRAAVLATALALGAVVSPGALSPAQAVDHGAWSVKPTPAEGSNTPRSYFILEGSPGDVINDSVRIQNWTKKPITFRVYGADGFNTVEGGFFALRSREDEHVDLGAWVKPATDVVTVHGRTQVDVPVKIKIPKNATPGDHVGGVVAMNIDVESVRNTGGVDIGIQRAVGARTYMRVSGTTSPGIAVSGVRVDHDRGAFPWTGDGDAEVSWTVENTGNLRLSPEMKVTVDGLGTRTVAELPKLIDLLPGQKIQMTENVSGISWLGPSDVTVEAVAGDDVKDTEKVTVWVFPWAGLLILLLLIALAVVLYMRRGDNMRRKLNAAEGAPKIQVSDEVSV